jgi:hypothetical protein
MIEIRNLRLLDGRNTIEDVTFGDYDRSHLLQITRAEFIELGEPTYVVVTVRPETFAESTQ